MSSLKFNRYQNGVIEEFSVENFNAFVIKPTGNIDKKRRFVWICPAWMATKKWNAILQCTFSEKKEEELRHYAWEGDNRTVEHSFYIEEALKKGFHVAGIEIGITYGSPFGVKKFEAFYNNVIEKYNLYRKVILICQSNGALMHYNWAIANSDCIDRILGVYPATDLSSWPGISQACTIDEQKLIFGYDMTPDELESRLLEFNPIDNLKQITGKGIKIMHIHGTKDDIVPAVPNTLEFYNRYKKLGGDMEIEIIENEGHKPGPVFYNSQKASEFLFG